MQNNTGLLILTIAVSIVAKGVLANEAVNYDIQTKAILSKEFGAKAGATVSNGYQIHLKKRYLLPQKSWCSVKEDPQRPAQVFSC